MAVISFLAVASAAVADGEDSDPLLIDLNDEQLKNGSWGDDIKFTTDAILVNENAGYGKISSDGMENANSWTEERYYDDTDEDGMPDGFETASDEVHAYSNVLNIGAQRGPSCTIDFSETFYWDVEIELKEIQKEDGSWNSDPGDTGIATYSMIMRSGTNDFTIQGTRWLLENEKEDLTWGSISDDSKAILALDSAGYDMWEEIAALMLKQRPDGSFGGIEDTSWAVMAMSTNLNDETMERMERAVAWLQSQEYDNNEDLANAALAEQYYEKAKRDWDPPDDTIIGEKGEVNGIIPPPTLIVLSMFIISGIALGYYLFARIEREAVLSGIRKELYSYIEKHPGEHLAHLTKKFNLSSSSARYHLSVLEGMDQIVSHKMGKYKRFYINKNGYSKYTNGNGYKHIMSALKNITARRIVKFIISHPEANQKNVSEALKLHPSTVNWHAERLRAAEVLSKRKNGKEIVYFLNEDVQVRKVIGERSSVFWKDRLPRLFS
jgi:predicted transcriptional regulator